MDRIIKQILLAAVITASALSLAEHPVYDPNAPFQINAGIILTSGQGIRGGVGPWVKKIKKYYKMAHIGGTPIFDGSFTSSSNKVQTSADFMDGPASPDEKMLSKVIVYDFDNPGNGVVAVNVAPLSSFPSEGELLLHPCLTFAKVAPIKYLAHYGNPSIQEKVVLVCTNAPGPLTEFYSADIQKLRNKLMTLCENQAFKQLLALVGHDPQLDEMNDLIFSSIYETATQMKKINAYVIDHIDTSDQAQLAELHQKLQGHSEISYIFTRDNQIFFLNKEMNTLENLKVIQQTFNEIVDDLDLDEHLLSLKNNDPVLTDVPVDLVRMNYLKKMLNQKDYNFHHTVQESIAKLQNTLGIIDAHYNQLDPQTQQLLQDFSRELSALQKKAHSKLQRAPAHLSIFSPPKPVGQSPQMVVKGNTRTFMVI